MKPQRRFAFPFAILLAFAVLFTPKYLLAQHGAGHAGGGVAHAGGVHPPGAAAPHAPVRTTLPPPSPLVNRGVLIPPRSFVVRPPLVIPILPSGFHPRRPFPPFNRAPFYGVPLFGFGWPFGGFGFGGYLGPGCYSSWNWGYGCNSYPYYGTGELEYYSPPAEQPPSQLYVSPPVDEVPSESNPDHVILYFKDGTHYEVTDYWLIDGKLHFTTVSVYTGKQTEHIEDVDELDLQKSVDVNTDRGFRFVLRPAPIEEYLKNEENPSGNTGQPQAAPRTEPAPDGPILPTPSPQT
jgi:hypothetical protein